MTLAFARRSDQPVMGPALNLAEVLTFPKENDTAMIDSDFAFGAVALCTLDRNKRFKAVNQRMAAILDRAPSELAGCSVVDFLPEAEEPLDHYFARADAGELLDDQELTWKGRQYQLSFNAIARQGRIASLSIAAVDVSRRVRIERRLRNSRRHLLTRASHDHLTGLLNRRGLEAKLHQEIRRTHRSRTHVAILVIDIDCFKAYNDSFGHIEGDKCLQIVAATIQNCARRAGDAAGRYGGEEFVLILPEVDSVGAVAIAENCRRAVSELQLRHSASDHGRITISVGVATTPPQRTPRGVAAQAAALMKSADAALYQAKDRGRDRVVLA